MKKSLQKNLKLILFLFLFLTTSIFCMLIFTDNYSATVKVFAEEISQEEISPLASEPIENKTELIINSVVAINREYDGTADVDLVVNFSNNVEGNDVSVTATGTMIDANVGTKKYVEISGFTIVGSDADKYILPQWIDTSPVYVDISPKQAELFWKTTQEPLEYVYNGNEQISSISCYYIDILGKKVNVSFALSGYQVLNQKTYTYTNSFLNSGNYTAKAIQSVQDANYNLIDSSGDSELFLTMSRAKSEIYVDENINFTYNGQQQDASICASLNNNEQTLVFTNNTFTTVEEGNNLKVFANAPQSLNYMPANTTYPIKVNKATSQIDVSGINKNFVYTGAEQSITSGATINNTEQKLVYQYNTFTTVAQANETTVIVFAPDSPNYNLVSTSFKISMQKATINTSSWRWSASNFTYNGKMHTLTVLNYNSNLVTASYNGSSNTEVGKYVASVVFVLKDSANYNPVTFESKEWEIEKAVISIPTIEDKITTYSGETQYACSLNSIYYTVTNNSQINAGSYTVSIKLNDVNNTVWSNGSEQDLTFNWTIKKAKIKTPHASQKFVYNGRLQNLDIEQSDKYTILNQGATEVGEHECYLVLVDSKNYEWESDASSTILTLKWVITSSENYNEASPMVAVVVTCILLIIVCVYITLHFTVVKKRRSKKSDKLNNLQLATANGVQVEQTQTIETKSQTKETIEKDTVSLKVSAQNKAVKDSNHESAGKEKDATLDKVNKTSLGQDKVSLKEQDKNQTEDSIIQPEVFYEETEEEKAFDDLENNNLAQDKLRKKRMLSRKKEDKKKRRKTQTKSTEPKKRGRPPKKQVATRGRPRRDVSKTPANKASKSK